MVTDVTGSAASASAIRGTRSVRAILTLPPILVVIIFRWQPSLNRIGKPAEPVQLVGYGAQAVSPEGDSSDVHRHNGGRQFDAADLPIGVEQFEAGATRHA